VTGQQAGLFGGPLYTLLKALTAVSVAERVTREHGVPAVPVFWIESEDHDWNEVAACAVLDSDFHRRTITLGTPPGAGEGPVSSVRLDPSVIAAVDGLRETLPPTEFTAATIEALSLAYRPGAGMSEAFGRWLEALLGHFCDPAVALVAPRIVNLAQPDSLVARYEAVRSSLDLGQREAPVVPYGSVSYVPSAAIICRRSVLNEVGGFDETLKSGEDVDLCWRFVEAGARLRYEPIAMVAHEHRTQLREWFARKAFYGESAAPLSVRHPGKTAPLVISGWTLVVWILLTMGSAVGYLASVLAAAITGRRIANSLNSVDTEPKEVAVVAAHGLWSGALQLAAAICRHYWPIALLLSLLSRRCRHIVLIAAIIDGVVDWVKRHGNADDETKPVGLVSYLLLKRLDDIAYGTGLWTGVVRERHIGALKPQIRT
jgi:mycofactocin system glycosyltransferase